MGLSGTRFMLTINEVTFVMWCQMLIIVSEFCTAFILSSLCLLFIFNRLFVDGLANVCVKEKFLFCFITNARESWANHACLL